MKYLSDILYTVHIRSIQGNTGVPVGSVCIDSRQAARGAVFVAIRGTGVDGHQFIDKAVAQGAVAVVCETLPDTRTDGVTWIEVESSAEAAGVLAHNFWGQPSRKVTLVGVTGTNGKTTIATLLYKLFTALGYTCGLVSTVENIIDGEVIPSTHTTPDAVALNALLHTMKERGCSHVFMEVSSHAVHQRRIAGLHFAGGIFSNISHDHLDYHKTFDEYIKAKKAFFDALPSGAFALTNADDKRGAVMLQNTVAKKLRYSLQSAAEFKGKILDNGLSGLQMSINDQEVHFRLIGEFNAYNLLAVYGAAVSLGERKEEVLQYLSNTTGAEGRFDYTLSATGILGIVDYAHTPDALENVLSTIGKLRKGHEQVITVVGCGGDRDKTKRPVMAAAAAAGSQRVILTSDNPRSEDPASILADMQSGLDAAAQRKVSVVPDREEAIRTAIHFAGPDDIVLVAGKGHEKYQEIAGVKHPFDDKEVLNRLFLALGK